MLAWLQKKAVESFAPQSLFFSVWVLTAGICLAQKEKPSIFVQGYRITVEDIQRTDVMRMETEINPLIGFSGQDMSQFVAALQQAATGGVPIADKDQIPPPNIGLALLIESSNKNKVKVNSIVDFGLPLTATDDQGKKLESPETPALSIHFPQFEKDKQDAKFVYFYQQDRDAEKIATLEGELSVTPGKVSTVEFNGPNFVNQIKRSGRDSFSITSLEQKDEGLVITMVLPTPQQPTAGFNNPQAVQAALLERLQAYRLEAEDDQGEIHKPRPFLTGNDTFKAEMSSSFSFQFGSAGNNQAGNGPRNRGTQVQVFNLASLPVGRSLKSIRVTMTEKTGTPRKLPFIIRDIPLP